MARDGPHVLPGVQVSWLALRFYWMQFSWKYRRYGYFRRLVHQRMMAAAVTTVGLAMLGYAIVTAFGILVKKG